jgi:hypothetical protein
MSHVDTDSDSRQQQQPPAPAPAVAQILQNNTKSSLLYYVLYVLIVLCIILCIMYFRSLDLLLHSVLARVHTTCATTPKPRHGSTTTLSASRLMDSKPPMKEEINGNGGGRRARRRWRRRRRGRGRGLAMCHVPCVMCVHVPACACARVCTCGSRHQVGASSAQHDA